MTDAEEFFNTPEMRKTLEDAMALSEKLASKGKLNLAAARFFAQAKANATRMEYFVHMRVDRSQAYSLPASEPRPVGTRHVFTAKPAAVWAKEEK